MIPNNSRFDEQGGPEQEIPPPAGPSGFGPRLLGLTALAITVASAAFFFSIHKGLLEAFGHLFDLAENPYYFYPGNIDWPAIGIAAAAALLITLVGYSVLSTLDLFIPETARFGLAYVVGLGVVGVLLEVETIFALHTREAILATIGLTLVFFASINLYRTMQPVTKGFIGNWGTCRAEIAHEYSRRFRESLVPLGGPLAIVAYVILLLAIAAVTLLTFYHGTVCPVTYWDSLILYVGYARDIFYERAFPFKAVAQVGVGLGANYPHLYALTTAATATVAGRWSDSFAQFGPPLAGLLSCLLVYQATLRLTRHRLLAIALTAIFRVVPYGIAYFIYASDYAFVMLFVAAFLYVALLYVETGLAGYFVLATLIPAFAMHINYLMGGLWLLWAAMVVLTHVRPYREPVEKGELMDEADLELRDMVDLQTAHPSPPTLLRFLVSQRLWGWLIIAAAVASPWYVRNWVLTGNPVYAFFATFFPRTVNYNQEVMDSARVEWTLNGDGIDKAALTGDFFRQLDRFRRARDVSGMEIVRAEVPLGRKLAVSPRFWLTDFHAWKFAPSLVGIALPGLLIFLLGARRPGAIERSDRHSLALRRFGWLCTFLLVLLLAYHYLLAGFYLYQIIPLVVLIPLFGVYFVRALGGKLERGLFVALALWTAVFPGLPYALMGFKLFKTVKLGNRTYSQFDLVALHHVGLNRENFYRLAFGDDVDAWLTLNTICLGEKVLTHENRRLVLDRRVGIVHFDDWEVQALWGKTADEQLEGLRKLGIGYYLFVPNEINHQVNRRLGPPASEDVAEAQAEPWRFSALRGWIEAGVLKLVDSYGDNRLYRFEFPK